MRQCEAQRITPRVRTLLESMLNSGEAASVTVAAALDETASNADVEGDPGQDQISFLTIQAEEIREAAESVIESLAKIKTVELKDEAFRDAEQRDASVSRAEDYYPGCIRAERRGADVLILRQNEKQEPLLGQPTPEYELTYAWLTNETADIRRVRGSEQTYWYDHEVDENAGLFDQFNLFP